ncbi:MAG: AarF/UbiB family protein, partial [Pirellulales bacterium]
FAKGLMKARGGTDIARQPPPVRIRLALMELGPTFIKLGQLLSTRPDVVGVELADELKKLQADVDVDPPEMIRALIESELGEPIEDLFNEFQDIAFASASIGQVHRAELKTGEPVVVKVQHINIERTVEVDLDIMQGLAQLAERIPEFSNYRPRATAAELQRTLRRELDFGREERNLQQFTRDFVDRQELVIPQPYSEYCTPRVLTMEYLDGVKLCDAKKLLAGGTDFVELARHGAEVYLDMIFLNGLYHADPHPGNILILPGDRIGLLDFGMVGRIDEQLREDIEDLLMSVIDKDSTQLTSIIMRIGNVPVSLDTGALQSDVTDYVEHYGTMTVGQFDLKGALNELTEIIRRHRIMLPASIALLLKTLVLLESSAKLLDAEFSLVEAMGPYRHKLFLRRMSPLRKIRKLQRIYSEFERFLEKFPRRAGELMQLIQSGKFDVHLDHRGLEPSVNRLVLGMLTSALFLGSSLMLSRELWPTIYNISVLGALGCSVSIMLGLRLLWAIAKSGHLDRRDRD